jgi:regulator of sigma E protease
VSWFLAALGFMILIVLHELGHFTAAKLVGMRVERFSLFFPPLLVRVRRGETEYAVGAVPLGGYVKIMGMNPNERIPPEIAPRAYYRQPPWKRIVVIFAGPAMNFLIAFAIIWALLLANGLLHPSINVDTVDRAGAAASTLRPGDKVLSIDGKPGWAPGLTDDQVAKRRVALRAAVDRHRCAGAAKTPGCVASTPATVVVQRGEERLTLHIRPHWAPAANAMLLGITYGTRTEDVGPVRGAGLTVGQMWDVTKATVSGIVKIFYNPQARKQVSGVVGSFEVTRETIAFDTTRALLILALISLSLAVINLFPFLPLDGGHIFWALAEKVRGRPIPFSVMERASVVGFMLVIALFVIGLSNDIGRLTGDGFNVR